MTINEVTSTTSTDIATTGLTGTHSLPETVADVASAAPVRHPAVHGRRRTALAACGFAIVAVTAAAVFPQLHDGSSSNKTQTARPPAANSVAAAEVLGVAFGETAVASGVAVRPAVPAMDTGLGVIFGETAVASGASVRPAVPAMDTGLGVIFGETAVASGASVRPAVPAMDTGLGVIFGETAVASGASVRPAVPAMDTGLGVIFGETAVASGASVRPAVPAMDTGLGVIFGETALTATTGP